MSFLPLTHPLAPCQCYILLVLGPAFLCLSLPESVHLSTREPGVQVTRWHFSFNALSFLLLCPFSPSSLSLFCSRVPFCLNAPPDQTLFLGNKIRTFIEHYVPGTVLTILQGLTWLNPTTLYEVDITVTSIYWWEHWGPSREVQEQAKFT